MKTRANTLTSLVAAVLMSGAAFGASSRDHTRFRENPSEARSYPRDRAESQVAQVRAVMLPLLRVTDHRIPLDQIEITVVDDTAINAATAGGGRYFVTVGLLKRASQDQLRGVLAHEIAHEDLGHAAKAQVVGAGLSIAAAWLERLVPGSAAVAPIAGRLISNNYTRPLELQADRHAVTLLERAGYPKHIMIDTLAWLMRGNGDSGGGLMSSHPATSERIQALQSLR